mmetsp:Transcript_178533/g.572173  ORF Transcript_178533/g.572173 Transcript_178533/m.572173 type:complete len:207 (-) Transcript_178533:13-633(-)
MYGAKPNGIVMPQAGENPPGYGGAATLPPPQFWAYLSTATGYATLCVRVRGISSSSASSSFSPSACWPLPTRSPSSPRPSAPKRSASPSSSSKGSISIRCKFEAAGEARSSTIDWGLPQILLSWSTRLGWSPVWSDTVRFGCSSSGSSSTPSMKVLRTTSWARSWPRSAPSIAMPWARPGSLTGNSSRRPLSRELGPGAPARMPTT